MFAGHYRTMTHWSPRRRRLGADAALVLGVVCLLAGVQFLVPRSAQALLYFRHDPSEVWTLLTASYVHADAGHLASNAVGYLLAATYAWALCVGAGRRRWFRRTFAVFLVVLPVLVCLASYAAFALGHPSVRLSSKGFSGVVGGFAGFVLVALYAYVGERRSARAAVTVCVSLFLLCLFSVDARYAGGVRPGMAGLVATGLALTGGRTAVGTRVELPAPTPIPVPARGWRAAVADAGVVALVCVVLGVMMFGLFPDPSAVVRDGRVVDVYAHAAGFFLGILLSAATLAVERTEGESAA